MFEKMMNGLQTFAKKIDQNKYLSVVKDALIIFVPITVVGSLASLFSTLICNTDTGLASISGLESLENLKTMFNAINFAGMTCITLGLVFLVGLLMSKRNGINELLGSITAFVCYLTVIPQFATQTNDDILVTISNVIPDTSMSAKCMLVGLFVGIVAVEILTKLMTYEKIKIHMPAGVPTMISESFNALFPVMLTVLVVALLGWIVLVFSGQYLTDLMYALLQKPIEGVMQSPVGILTVLLITNLLWVLGIHGGLVTRSVRVPFMLTALAANVAAVNAGGIATNPVTESFWVNFCALGGSGNTFALIIVILLFSKRKDYKSIAKLSFVPGLFGINEPMIFGLPIVLNPILAIPFILSGLVTAGIGLILTYCAIIPCSTVAMPTGLPIVIQAFVGYSGSIAACAAVVVCILVACLIYLPFILISNKMYEKELHQNGEVA